MSAGRLRLMPLTVMLPANLSVIAETARDTTTAGDPGDGLPAHAKSLN